VSSSLRSRSNGVKSKDEEEEEVAMMQKTRKSEEEEELEPGIETLIQSSSP